MKRPIVAYTATNATSLTQLSQQVTSLVSQGWQPYKGINSLVFPESRGSKILYTQALIKRLP